MNFSMVSILTILLIAVIYNVFGWQGLLVGVIAAMIHQTWYYFKTGRSFGDDNPHR